MVCVFTLYSKSIYFSMSEEPCEEPSGAQSRDVHPHSDGEFSINERYLYIHKHLQMVLTLRVSKRTALPTLLSLFVVCSTVGPLLLRVIQSYASHRSL